LIIYSYRSGGIVLAENKEGFLRRILPKLNKEQTARMIKEKKPGWTPSKKIKNLKREDLETEFVSLATILNDDELEEFLEVALTKRTMGYPAYTFKITQKTVLDSNPVEEKSNYTFLNSNQVTINAIEDDANTCTFKMMIKEHSETRMQEVLNSDSLLSRHPVDIMIDKNQEVLTMIVGKDSIQEVAKRFIQQVIKWPIVTFDISEDFTQSYEIGTTHYRTALIIDFVYNRLKKLGYKANFKEIKFLTGSESARSSGIRNVTINGNDILSSQLACEYVTVGSAVISFKLDLIYQSRKFSAAFYFKGDNYTQLKIVLLDVPDDQQSQIMNKMQDEYIDMCNNGISDMEETKNRLAIIKKKYLAPDKFVFESIQNVILTNNELLSDILKNTDNEESRELIGKTAYNNRILLDNTGYSEEDSNLKTIFEQLELDFDSFEELEEQEDEDELDNVDG
jgi:hypothetical protein